MDFGNQLRNAEKAMKEDVHSSPSVSASVVVHTGSPAKSCDPMIYGGFIEHFGRQIYGGVYEPGSPLADDQGFRLDAIEALKELKTPIVRWPGGCYVSGYHWQDGVGMNRRPTDDMAWGVREPHAFGTDEYIELCRRLNWKPYICNNAGNGTIQEMCDWIRYCNDISGEFARQRSDNGSPEPQNVRVWSIGNENYGSWEIGNKSPEKWASFVRDSARAMKKADPNVILTAAAEASAEWLRPILKEAGDLLDYISIHHYWLDRGEKLLRYDYMTAIMKSTSPDRILAGCIGLIDKAGYRGKVKIAFDEWNLRAWYHPGFPRKTVQDYSDPEIQRLVDAREENEIASQYTMADALFSASFFNACLRNAEDVGMANIAPLVNTRGPLQVHSKGIVRRTHFHTMAMYTRHLKSKVVKAGITAPDLVHGDDAVPVLDAIVTTDDNTSYAIALINRHPTDELSCRIDLKGLEVSGTFGATVLAGDDAEAYNDIENPDRVVPKEVELTLNNGLAVLPSHSLTILRVSVE